MKLHDRFRDKIKKGKRNYTVPGKPMSETEFKKMIKDAENTGIKTSGEVDRIIDSYISTCQKELKRKVS